MGMVTMGKAGDDYLKEMGKGGQTPPVGGDNSIADITEEVGNSNPVTE